MILLILLLISLQWLVVPLVSEQWILNELTQYITIASLFTYVMFLINEKTILIRSCFSLLAIDGWCDVIKYILWQFSDYKIDLSIVGALIFFFWLLFIVKRQYPERIDLADFDNVNILILKPKSKCDVIKGLIGYPAASICILANGYIWCFRGRSGVFERIEYNKSWIDSHLVINTKIKFNEEHNIILDKLIGTVRHPCIKCVFVIRYLLNKLGGKYAIKTWLDYIPGIYFMRTI
jgi:hypothetical protein